MTYCLGMRLNDGLVFVSDSRTNAGVDSVSTFRKCYIFDGVPDRVVVILTAGNLSIAQSVISLIEERIDSDDPTRSIYRCESMYDTVRLVGRAIREVYDLDGPALERHGAEFNVSLVVGGQIRGRRMRLFNVYAAGNFIEATSETPYFQLGETKYGKPIIERVLRMETPLVKAAKCALVSFDSTIRSNLSVAPPIDLVICPRDKLTASVVWHIEDDDPYFKDIRQQWGRGLRNLFDDLPDPNWANHTF